jgi:hypothetical protein
MRAALAVPLATGMLLAGCAAAAPSSAPPPPPYAQTGGPATSTPWTGDGPQAASRAWYLRGFGFGQDDEPGSPASMAVPECDSQLATNPDGAPASAAESWWKGCVAGEEDESNATPPAGAS